MFFIHAVELGFDTQFRALCLHINLNLDIISEIVNRNGNLSYQGLSEIVKLSSSFSTIFMSPTPFGKTCLHSGHSLSFWSNRYFMQ